MATDLKQVAERLTKCKHIESTNGACKMCHVGKEEIEISLLAKDWLAERDPTPLTVEVMQSFGATVRNVIADMSRLSFVLTIDGKWLCHTHSVVISTVGELRTLARLAGVELRS